MNNETRFCTKCSTHWPDGDFGVRKTSKNGRHDVCKPCMRGREYDLTGQQVRELFGKHSRCLCCGTIENLVIDHIIPRCLEQSSNDINNLQVLCRSCNSKKGASTIDYRGESPLLIEHLATNSFRTKPVIDTEIARALGSVKTPRKAASSARNIAPFAVVKPLADYECNCGQCPDVDSPEAKHGKTACPRGNVIYQRRRREKAKLKKASHSG